MPDIDLKKEAEDTLEIFAEDGILSIIKYPPEEFIAKSFNVLLLQLLLDGEFQLNLEKALLNNQSLITSGSIKLNDKDTYPSIANWILDFYSSRKNEAIDAISISDYFVNSKNYLGLRDNEKNYIRNLLNIYRNVKYFPGSMGNAPVEQWQIIPAVAEEDPLMALNKPQVVQASSFEESPHVESEKILSNENEKQLSELKALLASYTDGSLERKMVEEEIKKIEQSS